MSGQSQRRIPQGTEKADKLVAGRSFLDLAVFAGVPMMAGGVLMFLDVINALEYVIVVGAILGLDSILFRLIPDNESVTLWVRGMIHHFKTPTISHNQMNSDSIQADEDLDYDLTLRADGAGEDVESRSDLESAWWQSEENVVDQVGIEQVYPNAPIVLRTDGKLVAAVEVIGRDISLAAREETQRLIRQYGSHLNSVDFDTTTYITDDKFDLEGHVQHARDRLNDQDIQSRPILAELQISNIQRLENNRQDMGVRQRRTFEIVTVDPNDQQEEEADTPFDFIEPDSPVGRLLGIQDKGTGEEQRAYVRAQNELESRVDSLMSGLGGIEGVQAVRADTDLLVDIISNHYEQGHITETNWEPQTNPLLEAGNGTNTPAPGELFEK